MLIEILIFKFLHLRIDFLFVFEVDYFEFVTTTHEKCSAYTVVTHEHFQILFTARNKDAPEFY